MTKILFELNAFVWGAPTLLLILGVGLYLSLRLRFQPLAMLPEALGLFFRRLFPGEDRKGASSFRCLCTALAATVGTGNLVGVAGAICLGGPGAVFWMWLCAIFGMVTKYAEAALAVRFRTDQGGGPMYMMLGLGEGFRPMALCYALFGVVASFGVGNAAQVNAAIGGINGAIAAFGGQESPAGNFLMGCLLAVLLGCLLLGGGKRIGAAAERMVPVLALGYLLLCAGMLIARWDRIPGAFLSIFQGAFSPKAVTGGMLGSAFAALRVGCSRGVFTNEAGMGTAAIAHGEAQVDHPAEQGLMGMVEVFLDTIVLCTLTALVILCSGVPIPYGRDAGAALTTEAFSAVYGQASSVILAVSLSCFALAAMMGWGYYGGQCARFLFGQKAARAFALAQAGAVVLASTADTAAIWQLSELFNGLMAIPNLITLAALSGELKRLTKEYRNKDSRAVHGGNYADFHQRQPL